MPSVSPRTMATKLRAGSEKVSLCRDSLPKYLGREWGRQQFRVIYVRDQVDQAWEQMLRKYMAMFLDVWTACRLSHVFFFHAQ